MNALSKPLHPYWVCSGSGGVQFCRTKFFRGGGSLDQYKIMKAIEHRRTAVTLHVRYKMTSNQFNRFFCLIFFITQWNVNILGFVKYRT